MKTRKGDSEAIAPPVTVAELAIIAAILMVPQSRSGSRLTYQTALKQAEQLYRQSAAFLEKRQSKRF